MKLSQDNYAWQDQIEFDAMLVKAYEQALAENHQWLAVITTDVGYEMITGCSQDDVRPANANTLYVGYIPEGGTLVDMLLSIQWQLWCMKQHEAGRKEWYEHVQVG